MPLVAARLGFYSAEEDADPGERQAHGLRRAQQHAGSQFERFEIDIGLVEAIEQHQAVGAGLIEALGHVREVAEERAQLDGDRDVDGGFDGLQNVDVMLFDFGGGQCWDR